MLLARGLFAGGAYFMSATTNESTVEHFATIEDPRIERAKKHHLLDILVIQCSLPL